MRAAYAIAVLIVFLIAIVAPVMAANEGRYSYIKVKDVKIRLSNETAIIQMNYTVDEGTRFIFFLLGKQDLKNKLLKILNYDDAKMKHIDLSHAEFMVDGAALSYGNGIYWFPSHIFNVVIPSLTVQSPQVTRNFSMTREFPRGMGYFDVAPTIAGTTGSR